MSALGYIALGILLGNVVIGAAVVLHYFIVRKVK